MITIVGLGNPGEKYLSTRHNLGFQVVNRLANEFGATWTFTPSPKSRTCTIAISDTTVRLLEPQTFMNESGQSVYEVMTYYKGEPNNLWVVHDEIDLPLGTIRISFGAQAAGHKGVESIITALSTANFYRFRLGVGRPLTEQPVEKFVLESWRGEELAEVVTLTTLVLETIKKALQYGITTQTLTVKNNNGPA